ncbi:elongation factor Tu [Streptomyces hiroshimensis]|uniref:Elongation factor Tu-3 n=1 Tax=Streptomyces hiroshimensis TaxID=66424 RepID=A0ABQ2Z5P8_9ACTN|nr:elongation factor Tu [Streptomyces hiroshimensis]GGY05887.1 elongation factor Tu-3 [Streptomyces hiroshimensis]
MHRPTSGLPRHKPHVNIATLGPAQHGKTTLTAAVTRLLGSRGRPVLVPPARLGRAPEGIAHGRTVTCAHVAYETDTRHYVHTDPPGHPRFAKNLLAGTARLDGAVLVVSAVDGITAQTGEHLLLARRAGVRHLVVALTKADAAEPEPTDLVERDVRALLTAHGYDGEHTAAVRVSALRALQGDPRWTAAIEALLDAVDTYVPTPMRYTDAPFLLSVDKVLTLPRRGTAVTGVIERGSVRLRDHVQLLGPDGPCDTHVTGLEAFGRPLGHAQAGDRVALLLRGLHREHARRGDTVAAPGSVVPRRRFTADVRLLTADEGGRHTPLFSGYRPQFHLRTADVPGTVILGGPGVALPGESVTMTVVLDRDVPLETGLAFVVREGGRTVGTGTVSPAVP